MFLRLVADLLLFYLPSYTSYNSINYKINCGTGKSGNRATTLSQQSGLESTKAFHRASEIN